MLTFISQSICWLGILGNFLMYMVYSQTSLRSISVSVYFRALAITNFLANFYSIEAFFEQVKDYYAMDKSEFICKLYMYILYLTGPISAWFEVFAGFDRFLSVIYSKRFREFKKTKIHFTIVVFIVVFNLTFYSHILFNFKLVTYADSQTICLSPYWEITYLMNLYNSAVVPFVLMILTSIATFVVIIKSRRRVKIRMTNTFNNNLSKRRRNRDMKYAVTMIILHATFFLMNVPEPFYEIICSYLNVKVDRQLNKILSYTFAILRLMYFSSSFYVQLAVNSLVRKRFKYWCRKIYARMNKFSPTSLLQDRSG